MNSGNFEIIIKNKAAEPSCTGIFTIQQESINIIGYNFDLVFWFEILKKGLFLFLYVKRKKSFFAYTLKIKGKQRVVFINILSLLPLITRVH